MRSAGDTRRLWVVGSLLLGLMHGACGEDGSGPEDDGAETGNEDLDASRDNPTGLIDSGFKPTPHADAGLMGIDSSIVDPTTPPSAILPSDGSRLSTCLLDSDCGDNLTCVGALGTLGAGYCMDRCATDTDCPVLDGFTTTCSIELQCRFDCTGSGSGDGMCPANMECRNIIPPGVAVIPFYRCNYPLGTEGPADPAEPTTPTTPEQGTGTVPAYGTCDVSHGTADCLDGARCHVPVGGVITTIRGPGYCAPSCSAATDCQAPAGGTSPAVCQSGLCEYDCGAKGAVCPTGMDCRDVDDSTITSRFRCRIIE